MLDLYIAAEVLQAMARLSIAAEILQADMQIKLHTILNCSQLGGGMHRLYREIL